jgi:hypothetical protein
MRQSILFVQAHLISEFIITLTLFITNKNSETKKTYLFLKVFCSLFKFKTLIPKYFAISFLPCNLFQMDLSFYKECNKCFSVSFKNSF